ncbi:MAG TPA: DUF1080 domain-containing protein [Sphingomonas sp.]
MRPGLLAAMLCIATPAAAQSSEASDWTPLFNGKDFEGWTSAWAKPPVDDRPASSIFTVENGTIRAYADREAGTKQQQAYILTNGDYRDYRLSLEYKWGTKKFPPRMDLVRDAGVIFHAYDHSILNWPYGVEAQIQEGDTGDLWAISSRASSTILPLTQRYATPAEGGVPVTVGTYGSFQRIRHGALNELPEWNTLEIVVRGDTATYIVNGFVNMRATGFKRWDAASSTWVRLDHGKIALQAEFAEIYYRNIRLRPLTPEEMK